MPTSDISQAALDVLERCVCEGNLVRLPPAQLDRKLYTEVNEVLARLGGKWTSGRTKAHVFSEDPAPLIATVVETGEMPPKNPLAFFATPAAVVTRMLEMVEDACWDAGTALEPSAGDGAILRKLAMRLGLGTVLDAVEVDPKRATALQGEGFRVTQGDFLLWQPMLTYDVVAMNPPFTAPGDPLAYIAHIRRAFSLLSPRGELVSAAPSGFTFRADRRSATFRDFVDENGSWEPCDDGAFKASGAGVKCVLVHLRSAS